MPGKHCPRLTLEGTRRTLKRETAFAPNEHPAFVGPRRYRYHSPVVSAERCFFTDRPRGRGLADDEPHGEARAERPKVSRDPTRRDDPSRFVSGQELLRSLAARPRLPAAELDVSSGGAGGVADRIVAWPWETGGLHAPDAGFAGAA